MSKRLLIEFWEKGKGINFTITQFGPFANLFIKLVKRDVPTDHRHYFKGQKVFWISEAYKNHVISMIEHINSNPNQIKLFQKMKGQKNGTETY